MAVGTARGGYADRVLGPSRNRACGRSGDRDDVAQTGGVTIRDGAAQDDLVVEQVELVQQDRRLQRVHTAVHAEAHVVVAIRALAVDTKRLQRFEVGRIVEEDGPSISIASQRLGRKQPGRREGEGRT